MELCLRLTFLCWLRGRCEMLELHRAGACCAHASHLGGLWARAMDLCGYNWGQDDLGERALLWQRVPGELQVGLNNFNQVFF